MGKIQKRTVSDFGYGFVDAPYLSAGESEYSRRFEQQKDTIAYRPLTEQEKQILIRNGNYAANWDSVRVTAHFLPDMIRNSSFSGLVRIGDMTPSVLEHKELELPVGIYNSHIVSCDIGPDAAIHNVKYLAHFILEKEVMLSSIDEMLTSPVAKFGNGIVKDGEQEEQRIVLELCNENGKRAVTAFEGMQASDAYLWTRYRDDDILQRRFQEITDKKFDRRRGYYSVVGEGVVIKNSKTIKDVCIGAYAYIKGINKLKNVTINSRADAITQIGEGCELVNGIIGFGCRVFYGVKAVRFFLSSFSQLKYGARLINSFLGDNSTISCCEVLNALIFPAHEQHHNNSFLCAALVKGQSNMAAGATVGSNHNSRGADGEIIAERGFWPGLCVSLKHNSRFAAYTLLVKGDFLYELDIRLPFSLVSLDLKNDRLVLLPGYWFLYNAYALMRNTDKFAGRDNRKLKNQYFEYDILAPDTVNAMFEGLEIIELAVGKSMSGKSGLNDMAYREIGQAVLLGSEPAPLGEVLLEGVECSKRDVVLAKPYEAYQVYRRMIAYYAGSEIMTALNRVSMGEFLLLLDTFGDTGRATFDNVGGQLVDVEELQGVLERLKTGEIDSWEEIHSWYHETSASYPMARLQHALASYAELQGGAPWQNEHDLEWLLHLLRDTLETKKWLCTQIFRSREKDYTNPFRKMVYDNDNEMDKVVGALRDNAFIRKQEQECQTMETTINNIILELKKIKNHAE
ncbi:DUF4954 family protein [Sphingobacterium haloxyli]|uniref:DUF4954 domain-containing protein n=1 Tax=Sphingobacterium haloxyli TaxID=2100533 RepID=A0A2S9J2C0_9SPHI|nr:DUF4954 family protein [Sphingobacterium haloxyli]PRD46931.1 DUF4954 domain-containing protein [Sphingobacterium haloxyli]